MQAALSRLAQPELESAAREHALTLLRDEVSAQSQRISQLAQNTAKAQKTRWPMEEMLGSDFLSAAQRRLQAHCQRAVTAEPSQDDLWLRVDSYLLLQALAYLAGRLVEEFDVRFLQLRLQAASQGRAHLDLIWSGHTVSTETVMTWQMDPMQPGVGGSTLTVRDVVERHGGEMWFERERVRHQAFFRFELPLATPQEQLAPELLLPGGSRPEFYDFDLFQSTDESRALDERPLASLAFTVFDTETTGLQPSAGDEIIQLGAVRIVNGRLLRQECFDQLVDPGRTIPAASIPIHGITQDMVTGKPRITKVLPAFHAFVQDTVLVAHNAAFDMKFLQLQEAGTGVVFHQPVLDTLLLSALVHPNQESHRLEAIAERFNITVLGRHTALGDAIVTAEVLLRLIPLLQGMGIHTLGQAREAAQNTYFARLKY
jgi:DNA polymerase-3 subunit epsilon